MSTKKKGAKPAPDKKGNKTAKAEGAPQPKSGKKKKAVPEAAAATKAGGGVGLNTQEVQVNDAVDDLLTGIATLWTSAVATGHAAQKTVETVAYPVKEKMLEAHDGVKQTINPGAGGWAALKGQIGNPNALTFAHGDDYPAIQVQGKKIRDRE